MINAVWRQQNSTIDISIKQERGGSKIGIKILRWRAAINTPFTSRSRQKLQVNTVQFNYFLRHDEQWGMGGGVIK